MKGKVHLIAASSTALFATVLVSTPILQPFFEQSSQVDINAPIVSSILFVAGSSLGGLLPDIDNPQSLLGHLVYPLARAFQKMFGHRGFIHTPLFLALISFLYYIISNKYGYHIPTFFLGIGFGFLIHLIQDTFTKGGIKWLYPFYRKSITVSVFKSGTVADIFATILIELVIITTIIFNYPACHNFFNFISHL